MAGDRLPIVGLEYVAGGKLRRVDHPLAALVQRHPVFAYPVHEVGRDHKHAVAQAQESSSADIQVAQSLLFFVDEEVLQGADLLAAVVKDFATVQIAEPVELGVL